MERIHAAANTGRRALPRRAMVLAALWPVLLPACGGPDFGGSEDAPLSGGAGGGTSMGGPLAADGTCSMRVESGSHDECDWGLCGSSDPDSCCSKVTDYKTVRGTQCDGTCADLAFDKAHCGACDTPCTGMAVCTNGKCVIPEAAGGATSTGVSGGSGGSPAMSTGGAGGTLSGGSPGFSQGGVGASSGGGGAPSGNAGASSSAGGASSGGAGRGNAPSGSAGASAGGSASAYSANPCAGLIGSGLNCGANLVGGNPKVLYFCKAGTTYASGQCVDGCHAGAVGEPDYCIGSDPCASAIFDGDWCGARLSPPSDVDTLYTCKNRVTVSTASCSPCTPSPPGQADVCVPVEQGGGF